MPKSSDEPTRERRSGTDRRKQERRDPARQSNAGVLTTRTGERRSRQRRSQDRIAGKKAD